MASSLLLLRPPPLQVDDDDDSAVRRDAEAARVMYPCMPRRDAAARNRHSFVYDARAYESIRDTYPDLRPPHAVSLRWYDRVVHRIEGAWRWWRQRGATT